LIVKELEVVGALVPFVLVLVVSWAWKFLQVFGHLESLIGAERYFFL
jgi:hypothetical protein